MAKHSLEPDHWIDKYGDQLLGYALVRIPERDVAKDLVQDTFVTALKSKSTFRGEISEKNWLFLVLRSRILDYFKKKKEVLESDFGSEDDDESDSFFQNGHWIKDRAPNEWSTDKAIQQNEFMSVFTKCSSKLKEAHQTAFNLKYLEGMDSESICKELGISSSNYWVLIHRAKLQLRECLEKNWLNQ